MSQNQVLPTGYYGNTQTDCVWTAGSTSCSDPTTRTAGIWPTGAVTTCATRDDTLRYSTSCQYMFLSGCSWDGSACTGTATDGSSVCTGRTTEVQCIAYAKGQSRVTVSTSTGCTWSGSTCDGVTAQGLLAADAGCRARTQSTCTITAADVSSSVTRTGCVWDATQSVAMNKC